MSSLLCVYCYQEDPGSDIVRFADKSPLLAAKPQRRAMTQFDAIEHPRITSAYAVDAVAVL